ncbi:hypothetical protein GCM10010924_35390 [Rhizobium wenxiniae]|nr:hypothetical protein GCM10010924_35390 [Rhizobium wenxiniae]
MPTRIPGVKGEIIETKLFNEMGNPAAMLVAAMQKHDRTLGYTGTGRPAAIEEFDPVMARKRGFNHAFSLPLGCSALYT